MSGEVLERKLVTILSADVFNYSGLIAANEDETIRTFKGHKEIFESFVSTHRGRIFNTAGDAILVEFQSAVEAVRCATEIQQALVTRNESLPSSRQVKFRIGINLGDVVLHGTDLLGDGVNVAARIQASAMPGGIAISGSVYDQIVNKLALSFTLLGEKNYRNIPSTIRTYAIETKSSVEALPQQSHAGPAFSRIKIVGLVGTVFGAILIAFFYSFLVAASHDGRYSGQVCLGQFKEEDARCYVAQGILISSNKVSARYPLKDNSLVNVVAGDVTRSGEVTIDWNVEKLDGERVRSGRLVGAVKNGHLVAVGNFPSRTISVDWHRE